MRGGPAPLLAAASALLLLVSLFLSWWEDGGDGISAWTTFEVHDLLLAAIALVALWRAAALLGAVREGPPVRFWMLGAAATVIVASQLINKPPIVQLVDDITQGGGTDPGVGAWLALAASLLLLISGLMNRVRVELVHDDRPAAAPAERPAASTGLFGSDGSDPVPGDTQPTRPLDR